MKTISHNGAPAPEPEYYNEAEAAAGLDICGYAGKWQKAQERNKPLRQALGETAYWTAVRTYFLELGGDYVQPICTPTEPVATLPNGKPVGMSYTEWMLGRMPHPPVGGPQKVRQG